MLKSTVVHSKASDSRAAAREISARISEQLGGQPPQALVVFASPKHDHVALLRELDGASRPGVMVGASSAGEFTTDARGEGMACALALRSDDMEFAAGVGRGLTVDRAAAAREVVSSFRGLGSHAFPFRTALVMTDALAGHADDLVDHLTLATAGGYQFFGGGAGDDAQFKRTPVFFGTQVLDDAVVALEILSKKQLGIGVGHGWEPASKPMRVTDASGSTLISLNGLPAVDAFSAHAKSLGKPFDRSSPLPFFLHNIVGVETASGHRLRVPLAVTADGAVQCAAAIPVGSTVYIMRTTSHSAVDAASRATKSAIESLGDAKPAAALFFDCVATRLRMGDMFGLELDSLPELLGDARYVGCNTHGQIARAAGQFGGFHNCTAVVCVIPE